MRKLDTPKPYRLFMGSIASLAFFTGTAWAQPVSTNTSSLDSEGLINEYCVKCHNLEDYSGGIDLEGLGSHNIAEFSEIGEKVILRLRAGMMPPAGEPRPEHDTMQGLAKALEQQIDAEAHFRPGRPGIHRLNRSEYANAVRDLLALDVNASDFLPPDDSSNGFDNQAGSLTLSPALLEAYLSASAKLSQLAIGQVSGPTQALYRTAEDANQNFHITGLPFGTRGGLKFTHNFPVDAEYAFKIFAITLGNMGSSRPFGNIKGEQLKVLVDGVEVKAFDWDKAMSRTPGDPDQTLPIIDLSLALSAGPHEIGITFLATNFAPVLDTNNDFERSTIETGGIPGFTFYPHVGSVRVDGPYNTVGTGSTPSREKIFVCYPSETTAEEACAIDIIRNLTDLAYRGNAEEIDYELLREFYQQGLEQGGFENGIRLVLQRVLAAPKFIYRIERQPDNLYGKESYAVSDIDLASRLSFLLWSSIPDRELLELAANEELSSPKVLQQQLKRMLADPKAAAFTHNFAGQWLALRNLDSHVPVIDQFPDFDNLLRQSFKQETELLFDSLIRENRPVTEILTADYTFVNERLALHYGMPGIVGERFRRVELEGEFAKRRGILGKGSLLTVASQPGRTSPVIRGYWVLSNILGVEPPPPPPDVPSLEDNNGDAAGNAAVPSMRQQMESHRSNPACQGCHRLMDPIGFALESFDAVGRYRTVDNGNPINTSVRLHNGMDITETEELVPFLLEFEESIVRNFTQKLLTYALGRGMEYEDMPLVRKVMQTAAEEDYRFQALILAVISSDAFLKNSPDTTNLVATATGTQ